VLGRKTWCEQGGRCQEKVKTGKGLVGSWGGKNGLDIAMRRDLAGFKKKGRKIASIEK